VPLWGFADIAPRPQILQKLKESSKKRLDNDEVYSPRTGTQAVQYNTIQDNTRQGNTVYTNIQYIQYIQRSYKLKTSHNHTNIKHQ